MDPPSADVPIPITPQQPGDMSRCQGIRVVGPLDKLFVVSAPADPDLSGVVEAFQRSRAKSANRWRDPLAGPARIGPEVPDVGAFDEAFEHALSVASPDIILHVPSDDGGISLVKPLQRNTPNADSETSDVDGIAFRGALDRGGISLAHAERYIGFTDYIDDLIRVLSAPVVATAVWGAARATSVRCGNLAVVFAIGSDVLVRSTDGVQELLVPAGTSAPFEQFGDLVVDRGGVALVVAANRATRRDLRSIAAVKASGSPVLRGDVPVDIHVPARHYGNEGDTMTVDHFNDALGEVFAQPSANEAVSWWRAGLRAARAQIDLLRAPDLLDDASTENIQLLGTLVGGVGVVRQDGQRHFAFGGRLVEIDDHLLPLVECLVGGAPFHLKQVETSCPNGDPRCVVTAVDVVLQMGMARLL